MSKNKNNRDKALHQRHEDKERLCGRNGRYYSSPFSLSDIDWHGCRADCVTPQIPNSMVICGRPFLHSFDAINLIFRASTYLFSAIGRGSLSTNSMTIR